jgi:hypothetical protein
MSDLNRLLDSFAPPAVPEGLAARAVAAAIQHPQEKDGVRLPWRRGDRRCGWKRPLWIGSAAIGLAFTSAVAAEVVSGGAIEIPVAHQVVAAIPALNAAAHPKTATEHRLAAVHAPKPQPAQAAPVEPSAVQAPASPRREIVIQRFHQMQQAVAERRAAGLPTPRADLIERQAKTIVERREAKGLPTPSLDEVELRLTLREARTQRILRQIARDPSVISDQQVQRFASLMPPPKRERFLALGPDQQRALIVRLAERMAERRAMRQAAAAPQQQAQPPEEESSVPPR